jgi:predicted dehydrogenase
MDAPVGVGIMGSGFMGRTWAEAIRQNDDARLVGIAGGTRALALGADYDVPVVEIAAMLGDPEVDLVLLATPPRAHPDQAIAAADAGKHLLIEKPMANTVAECDRIIAAATRNDVRLAIVSQHRFRRSPLAVRRLIDDGLIGDVRMIRAIGPSAGYDAPNDTWKADPNEQTVWADWAAHACDITRWMAGSEPTIAFAQSQSYQPEPPPDQSTMAVYQFGNGVLADIWLTYEISPPGLGSALQFLITGSKGIIDFDSYGSVRMADAGGWRTVYEQPSFDPMDPLNPVRIQAYSDELTDVVGAIREGREPRVHATTARRTIEMVEAAERSIRSGEAVHLPLS